ncbi:FecR family protein [Echinicola shivajiensis]|uniref:FecR family protein n=1 Tax=Echinicola shivajiensis TaxID=1035916 RepID=UPI001BFCD296|nr:FecR domain-containing protein [Echinicola shivajiensis]
MKEETPNNQELKKLIDKALQGNLSSEERIILDQWYASFEEELPLVYTNLSKEDFKLKFYQETLEKFEIKKRVDKEHSFLLAKMAASLVLLAAVVSVLFYFLPNDQTELSYIEYKTENGERKSVSLNDGSKVLLDGQTILQVVENFEEHRNVKLIGRAFFEVKRNESSPFTIKTENLTTTVLGTSFVIDAMSGQQEAVGVKSGLVKVLHEQDEEMFLKQGEQAILAANILSHSEIENVSEHFGWVDNKLVFYNDDIGEVAQKIESWYGVKIQLEGSPDNVCLLTGTYSDLKINELLEIISFSIPIKYEINGKVVKINSEPCK